LSQNVTFTYEPRPGDFAARLPRKGARSLADRRHKKHSGRRALILLAAVAVPAFAAPGQWSGFDIGNAGRAEVLVEPMPFEKAGDSFPGSAFYYLAPDEVLPPSAANMPLAPDAHSDAVDAPSSYSPAARAMRIDNSGVDRSRAIQCLTAAIYYEAASEPDAGQAAVAQVVLNRVAHPSYPNTVCGVVYQGSERSTGCQFSFTCDGSLARIPNRMFWQRAESVARSALSGYVYAPVGLATHYHTIAVHPYWAPKLNYLTTIGAHRFYSFHGAAGAPGTFRFAYVGGEPMAAPHARNAAADAQPDLALDPLAMQRAYDAGLKSAQSLTAASAVAPTTNGLAPVRTAAAPAYSSELQARGGEKLYRGEKLPDATGVRPEYENSGRWISQPGT